MYKNVRNKQNLPEKEMILMTIHKVANIVIYDRYLLATGVTIIYE